MQVHVGASGHGDGATGAVTVNGVDITSQLRTAAVDRIVSAVSAHPEVRLALIAVQREIGRSGAVVMAGRDIGTVVLPEAELKVFLRASPDERARRRHEQLAVGGTDITRDEVYQSVLNRDTVDSQRDISPLRPADDALIIDSDCLTIEDVANVIIAEAERRIPIGCAT